MINAKFYITIFLCILVAGCGPNLDNDHTVYIFKFMDAETGNSINHPISMAFLYYCNNKEDGMNPEGLDCEFPLSFHSAMNKIGDVLEYCFLKTEFEVRDILFFAPGYKFSLYRINSNVSKTVNLKLELDTRSKSRFLDVNGIPIADAELFVSNGKISYEDLNKYQPWQKTDNDGFFWCPSNFPRNSSIIARHEAHGFMELIKTKDNEYAIKK